MAEPLIRIAAGFDFSGANADVQTALEQLQRQFNAARGPGYKLPTPQSVVQTLNSPGGAEAVRGNPGLQAAVDQVNRTLAPIVQAIQRAASATAPTTSAGTGTPQKVEVKTPPGGMTPTQERQVQTESLQALQQINTKTRAAPAGGTSTPQSLSPQRSPLPVSPSAMMSLFARGGAAQSVVGAVSTLASSNLSAQTLARAAGAVAGAGVAGAGSALSAEGLASAAGPIGTAVAAAITLALGASSYSTGQETLKGTIAANVAGQPWNGPLYNNQFANSNVGSDLFNQYEVAQPQVAAVIASLGEAGVKQGPNGSNIAGNTANVLAFSSITGTPQDQTSALVSSLSVQGGMSATQIGAILDMLVKAPTTVGQSMTKLVATLQGFVTASGGIALGLQGQTQLAALQGFVGPGMNAGTAVGTMAGATGIQRQTLAASMGLTTSQFMGAQQNPLTLYQDAMNALLKDTAGITNPQQRVNQMETINQSLGLLNTAGMAPEALDALMQQGIAGGPAAAAKSYQTLQQKIGPISGQALQSRGAAAARDRTNAQTILDNLGQAEGNRLNQAVVGGGAPSPTGGAGPGGTPAPSPGTASTGNPITDLWNAITSGLGSFLNGGTAGAAGMGGAIQGSAAQNQAWQQYFDTHAAAGTQRAAGAPTEGTSTASALGGLNDSVKKTDDILTMLPQNIAQAIAAVLTGGAGAASGGSPGGGAGSLGGSASGSPFSASGIGTGFGSNALTPPGKAGTATIKGMPISPQVLAAYQAASTKYGVPLNILLAQGFQESGLNPNEPGGGIGQFEPGTWAGYQQDPNSPIYGQKNASPYNLQQATLTQAYYDAQNKKQFGTWDPALDAYNRGAGAVQQAIAAGQTPDSITANGNYGSNILAMAANSVAITPAQVQVTATITVNDQTANGISAKVGTTITQSQQQNPTRQRSGRAPAVTQVRAPLSSEAPGAGKW